MSPWKILFDLIGWWILAAIVLGCVYTLVLVVARFARDLWDARGETPREGEWDRTSTYDRTPGGDK